MGLCLQSSLIAGKLQIDESRVWVGSDNARYRNQKSPTIPYFDKAVGTIGLLPVGSIEEHPRSVLRSYHRLLPRFPTIGDQQGGGAGSTSLGSIALSPSGQVNFVKSILPSIAFSLWPQRLRLQKSE
jgi:hypothetical protein